MKFFWLRSLYPIQLYKYFSCASTQLTSEPKHNRWSNRGRILQWNFTCVGWLWACRSSCPELDEGGKLWTKVLGLAARGWFEAVWSSVCILKGTACALSFAGRSWAANLANPWACLGPGVRFRGFLSHKLWSQRALKMAHGYHPVSYLFISMYTSRHNQRKFRWETSDIRMTSQ